LPTLSGALRSELPMRGGRVMGSVSAKAAPALDPNTGTAFILASGGADVGWEISQLVTLGARGGYSRVIEGAFDGSRTLSGEVSALVPLRAHLSAATAVRVVDLRPEGQGSATLGVGRQWSATVSLRWDHQSSF
jgi:hypothetical protein